MDDYLGYNQIKVHPEDEEMATFHSPQGVFYCKVMPLVLKNARATYQRPMTVVFNGNA